MDHKDHNHVEKAKNESVEDQGHNHCCDHDHEKKPADVKISAAEGEILTTFKVSNMDCADEIKAINESLKYEGVKNIQANLMSSTVQIVHTPEITPDFLMKRIETTVVRIVSEDSNDSKNQNRNRIILVGLSGVLMFFGLCLQWLKIESYFDEALFGISIVVGGYLVFPKAFGALRRKTLDMNVLMALAVIGAIFIKEYAEASAVVFLFSLSELLESLSVQRARRAIQELLKIAPQHANRIKVDGSTEDIKVENIQVSEKIRVKAGESIPLDGAVMAGASSVNQAPLTGESMPVAKAIGDIVYAGTINQEGSLDIQVTKIFSNSKISQVIQLVEEAQSQRAVSQKFVDRFARIYTPAVLVMAVLTFLIPSIFFGGDVYAWLYKALVLLVIACPCALVISTPVSIVSSLTALAKKGVLVKGGATLEILGKIKALAVDKTGTLTEGKPKVQEVLQLSSLTQEQIIEIAASLEGHSTHPLAEAILNKAKEMHVPTKEISDFKNISGRGIEASFAGKNYFLGNHRFAHELGVCTPELEKKLQALEERSLSVVVVGGKSNGATIGEVLGVIAVGDQVRSEAKNSLLKIKSVGVSRIVMLSGDNQKTATAVGVQVGVDESFGELLPEGKVQNIEMLKSKFGVIGMIGDGINDAPAMAKSSIGIAMGFVGSDTAIETADVTLMTDDLNQVAVAIKAGQRTLRVIQFNIAFALITKAIFLVLTFFGHTNLWIAVAADTGAALFVILNSMRLLKVEEV